MPKNADVRIAEALDAIEENGGRAAREWVYARLPSNAGTLATWSADISLGEGSATQRAAETKRRCLVRGVLLAYMAADISGFRKAMVKDALKKESAADLKNRLLKFLPSTQIVGNFSTRTTWDPGRFTNPTNHNDGTFRYVITGVVKAPVKIACKGFGATDQDTQNFVAYIKKFPPDFLTTDEKGKGNLKKTTLNIKPALRYLSSPDALRYDIISTSVIDQEHKATYFPWGFILRVPPENIISAQFKDQGVANRPTNVITEMERVHRDKGLATPEEVLAATTGRNGETGYNEVVVLGTSPEGKQIDVTGIFVKVTPDNKLYTRNREGEKPYVAELVEEIKKCSRAHNIPVVKVPDPSGKASTADWPF